MAASIGMLRVISAWQPVAAAVVAPGEGVAAPVEGVAARGGVVLGAMVLGAVVDGAVLGWARTGAAIKSNAPATGTRLSRIMDVSLIVAHVDDRAGGHTAKH